jgi:putative redox protein
MAEQTLRIAVTADARKMKTTVHADGHQFVIDEPPVVGGTDEGGNPLQYFLGALCGCQAVIAQFLVQELNFQLDGIHFDVEGTLDPRGMRGDPNVRPYFDKVVVRATVQTRESDERLQELAVKAEQRCPVSATMKAAGIPMDAQWRRA